MKTTGSLRSAVDSLRDFIAESSAKGATTPSQVRQHAAQASFPYPELAAQVFKFLKQSPTHGARLGEQLTQDDISDAFLALLMDADAVEALGAGKTKNPWLNVRQVLRNTGANLGASLLEVYHVVRQTGLGYTPTILDLASLLKGLFSVAHQQGITGADALRQLAAQQGLAPWQIALALVWMRRRKKGDAVPTDADLEEIFADPTLMAELQQTAGPWEVYTSQGEALRTLRHFGESLEALADATEE